MSLMTLLQNVLAAPTPISGLVSPMATAMGTTMIPPSFMLASKNISNSTSTRSTNNTLPYAAHNPAYSLSSTSASAFTATSASQKTRRMRKRHSKRHSIPDWYDYANFDENSTALEWSNPCNGYYDEEAAAAYSKRGKGGHFKRRNKKITYNNLKKSAGHEYKTLNGSAQFIDISDIEIWTPHNLTYKFLPKLKENSSIALNRWYRNMQTYVGSFAFLRRIQNKWDAKLQKESSVGRELKRLQLSSRHILCELETAINSTRSFKSHKKNHRLLPSIMTRQEMNKHLKLRTKTKETVFGADTIDLKFVKYYYYEFLETMWKILRRTTKRNAAHKPILQLVGQLNETVVDSKSQQQLNKQITTLVSSDGTVYSQQQVVTVERKHQQRVRLAKNGARKNHQNSSNKNANRQKTRSRG